MRLLRDAAGATERRLASPDDRAGFAVAPPGRCATSCTRGSLPPLRPAPVCRSSWTVVDPCVRGLRGRSPPTRPAEVTGRRSAAAQGHRSPPLGSGDVTDVTDAARRADPAPRPVDGVPVVGMVGGGQLARMTHQAAIGLGSPVRVLSEPGRRRRRAGRPRRRRRRPRRPRRRCAAFARGCDVRHLRPRARADRRTFVPLVADGVAVRPGPDALEHAQDKLVMRRAAQRGRRPVPAVGRGRATPRGRRAASAPRWAGRSCSRRRAAATTARACGSSTSAAEAADWLDRLLAGDAGSARRGAGRLHARAGRAGRALAVGQAAAYPVVRDGAGRRASAARSSRPRPAWPTTRRRRPRRLALRHRRSARRGRPAGRRAVRHRRTGVLRQRARDAAAQQRALDDRRRGHLPVRAAPARGARPARSGPRRRGRRTP